MNIRPLRDLVLVALEDEPATPSSAIEIVRVGGREPTCFARVHAIGPEVRDTHIGQRVTVSRLQGIEIDGRVLLPETAVLAHLENTP